MEGAAPASVHILLPDGTTILSTAPATGAISLPFFAVAGTSYSVAVRGNRPAARLTILSNQARGSGQTIVLDQVNSQSTGETPLSLSPPISLSNRSGEAMNDVSSTGHCSHPTIIACAQECRLPDRHDIALGVWQPRLSDLFEHVARSSHRSDSPELHDSQFAEADLSADTSTPFVLAADFPLP